MRLVVLIVIDKTGRLLGTAIDMDVIKEFKNNHKCFMREANAVYVQSREL